MSDQNKELVRRALSALGVGELMGIAPTGKDFEIQQFHEYRIQDGQIAEHWACRDDLGMLRQLGVLPDRQMAG